MATVTLTTTPTQIDDGTAASLAVVNTSSVEVVVSRAGTNQPITERLRPGRNTTVYPEGNAVTAATVSGAGSVTVTTTAKPAGPITRDELSGTYARQATPTVVLFGDSRTADCNVGSGTTWYTTNLSWWDWGQARTSGGPVFDVAANSGIGGNTTTQMLARFDTDVTPYAPMAMTCWGGTNDGWVTQADVDASVANIDAILAKARAQGIYVFLITETPSSSKGSSFNQFLPYYNDRLRYLAATRPNVELWDFYGQLVDPTSTGGAPKSGVLRDGLHLNAAGCSALATYVGTKLARWPYRLAVLPQSPLDSMGVNGNTKNVVSNPLMTSTGGALGTGDSGTVPGSWTSSGTPTAVFSTPARADGYGNNLQAVITATDSSSKFISQTLTASRIIAGGTYVMESGLDITSPQNLYVVRLTALITVGGQNYTWGWGPQQQASAAGETGHTAMSGIIRSRPFTVPAGSVTGASLTLQVNHSAAGTSTVAIGRVSLKRVA